MDLVPTTVCLPIRNQEKNPVGVPESSPNESRTMCGGRITLFGEFARD